MQSAAGLEGLRRGKIVQSWFRGKKEMLYRVQLIKKEKETE